MHDPVPAVGEILPILRAATNEAHQEMEREVDIEGCVADERRYRRLLQAFHGFYRPLETRLNSLMDWQEHGLDLSSRQKTPWLAADLRALGLTGAEINGLPVCADLPPMDSPAQCFGCLYVLEGATLGGRQITSFMKNSPVPAEARHFFGSYGPQIGARWREFLAVLEGVAREAQTGDHAQIIHAAQQTFACLHRWIVRSYALS